MASRPELEAQAAAQAAVVAAAWSQMQQAWAELGLTSGSLEASAGIRALVDLVSDLVTAWGEVASTLAADFYDDLRNQADPGGVFEALILDPLKQAQVDRLVVTTIEDRTTDDGVDAEKVLADFEGTLQRLLKQASRETIDLASVQDPAPVRVRVARIPMGAETCAFCLVMASRGYVYRSVTSAGQETRYHDFCDCEQDVTWSPDPQLPEGYDPGELYGRYEEARRTAGSADLRKILKQLRLQEGIR